MSTHGGVGLGCPYLGSITDIGKDEDRSLRRMAEASAKTKTRKNSTNFRYFQDDEETKLGHYCWGVRRKGRRYETCRDSTRKLLAKLANRMQRPVAEGNEQFNPLIPAGYTYLGQLIAHDMVMSETSLASGTVRADRLRNHRTERLLLDTLYGGGPEISPIQYALQPYSNEGRCFLRLGRTALGSHNEVAGWPERDVPRVTTVDLNDDRGGVWPQPRDALIADPRNDDSLMLSQLIVLFHHAHNTICRQIDGHACMPTRTAPGRLSPKDGGRLFRLARKLLTRTWRRIAVKDYLGKILHPDVFAAYPQDPEMWSCKVDDPHDPRMPVEFSHGAFRFGHSMVRSNYRLNEAGRQEGVDATGTPTMAPQDGELRQLLGITSNRTHTDLPLGSNWAVQWGQFFKFDEHTYPGAVEDVPEPQLSRLISPSIVNNLVGFNEKGDGYGTGMPYRDLVSAVEIGTRSAASLSVQLSQKFPDTADTRTVPEEGHGLEEAIEQWLGEVELEAPLEQFTQNEVDVLAKDPPLPFFVPFEAWHDHDGRHLGLVGSAIVAETFASALAATAHYLEDEELIVDWEQRLRLDSIERMDQLCAYVAADYKLAEVSGAAEIPLI